MTRSKTRSQCRSPARQERDREKSEAENGADKAILSYYGPATCSRQNLPALQSGGAGCNPPIWRRLHVRSNSSIATLHELLQIALDWSDFHLLCAPPSSKLKSNSFEFSCYRTAR
ncbi:MAG: hypothetical protein JO151_01940 [Verrucomicrobia bacterium]|nr:hypothetical protein [Verrucomicrobiota bacterium]